MQSLWRNLRWKLAVILVLAVIIWFAGGLIGFPIVFRFYFIGYALITLPFFMLLDTRFGTEPRRGGLSILAVFLIPSVILVLVGRQLPQYNPEIEQEKITRIHISFLDRQKPDYIEALRQEANRLGVTLVVPEDEELAIVEEFVPSPEMIERGKVAYDDWECSNCHQIGGKGGVKRRGPELGNIGSVLSFDTLRAKIVDPRIFLTLGFEKEYNEGTMPTEFGERLSDDEINALAAYLFTLKDTSIETPQPLFPGTFHENEPAGERGRFYEIPVEYQKVMPPGWWTDPEIVIEGKAIFEGRTHSAIICAACHGRDGIPVLAGAFDFRDYAQIESISDVYWYWRIATGVPETPMTPLEGHLLSEEILKVMAYENTFAYDGAPTDHARMFFPARAEE